MPPPALPTSLPLLCSPPPPCPALSPPPALPPPSPHPSPSLPPQAHLVQEGLSAVLSSMDAHTHEPHIQTKALVLLGVLVQVGPYLGVFACSLFAPCPEPWLLGVLVQVGPYLGVFACSVFAPCPEPWLLGVLVQVGPYLGVFASSMFAPSQDPGCCPLLTPNPDPCPLVALLLPEHHVNPALCPRCCPTHPFKA